MTITMTREQISALAAKSYEEGAREMCLALASRVKDFELVQDEHRTKLDMADNVILILDYWPALAGVGLFILAIVYYAGLSVGRAL